MAGLQALDWATDGADWPHRDASRFVDAAGLRWHVQQLGASGPVALLIHGTGASTHSFAGLAPLLRPRCRTLAMDLPGHAFTQAAPGTGAQPLHAASLPAIADAIGALLAACGIAPADVALAVGHSAGAAIAVRMALDGRIAPQRIASLNGALLPFAGLAGQLFSPAARLLAGGTWAPRLFAWRAGDAAVLERLLAATGSTLDARGVALYHRLIRHSAHAAGALRMMAAWDLQALERDLPRLAVPLDLIVGTADRTVPPTQAARVRLRLPSARIVRLEGLGHLAHEERPEVVAAALLQEA